MLPQFGDENVADNDNDRRQHGQQGRHKVPHVQAIVGVGVFDARVAANDPHALKGAATHRGVGGDTQVPVTRCSGRMR